MKFEDKLKNAQTLVLETPSLPTIPEVATRVAGLLNSPEVNIDEVAETILTDQVLAARVIKIVNSPFFRPAQEISSVKRALVYLGLHHIRDIALTCSIIKAFEDKEGLIDIKSFWEHSFGVGVVARIIAQKVQYPNVEKAYIVGVVHDIGEVFLSYYHKEKFSTCLRKLREAPHALVEMEEQVFNTSHCEIGLALGDKWNFPAEYRDVIAYHHNPAKARVDAALVAIINLADLFCSVRGLSICGDDNWLTFSLQSEPAWDLLRQHFPALCELDVEKFSFELDDRIADIKELVAAIFDSSRRS